jgi:hypothetical protein
VRKPTISALGAGPEDGVWCTTDIHPDGDFSPSHEALEEIANIFALKGLDGIGGK